MQVRVSETAMLELAFVCLGIQMLSPTWLPFLALLLLLLFVSMSHKDSVSFG